MSSIESEANCPLRKRGVGRWGSVLRREINIRCAKTQQ